MRKFLVWLLAPIMNQHGFALTEEEKAKLKEEGKDDLEINYLDEIAKLKDKMDNDMISKEEYEKLKAEHKKMLDEYINKRPAPKKEKPTHKPVKELAEKLRNVGDGDMTNREYIKTSLEYRAAHIAEFGTDPWTNFGSSGPEGPNDETNKVASRLQSLVEENESPSSFRIAMDGILKDNQQLVAKLNRKRK